MANQKIPARLPPQETPQTWHDISIEDTLELLQATPAGLSEAEVEQRLSLYGFNHLPVSPRRGAVIRFLLQFHNVLIYVLLTAALLTAFLEQLTDTLVILAVVVVNALIGFIQEGKAEKSMEAIRQMLAPVASVLRHGERHTVAGARLVPGDIVLLEAGDKIPADLRLLEARGMTVQEAILTGESVPVEKRAEATPTAAALGDRFSMAFSGTLVASGQGKGIVVGTGSKTEIGRISGMMETIETLTTPLVEQMAIFARWLTAFILLAAALLFAFGYFVQGRDFTELFMIVISLSVAAIPEGLPAVLTITLAIGVQAMARRNAIVRRLPAIETLGSVSVICTDKTGTLTCNEMMVTAAVTAGNRYDIAGDGYVPVGEIRCDGAVIDAEACPILMEMARVAVLCNDASLHNRGGGWAVHGDPMEGALLVLAHKAGMAEHEEKRAWPRTDIIPFDAKHRFMATLNHSHERQAGIFVKGAPEQVLAMCRLQRSVDGNAEPIGAVRWLRQAEDIAGAGQRVLALAVRPVAPEHTVLSFRDVEGELTLLGLVGLMDPPRPEAVAAVAECHAAGIRVKMITGDHARTAASIGRQVGLRNTETVLTGAELDAMSDADLAEAVKNTDIFARTSPEHKLRLVMALQAQNLVVAMTGDGVNDAPALKRADVGIAMGRKGSEAAKEAAELVLADDNFASIVAAVREGRTVYDNLKKVISWTLPTNAGQVAAIIVALLFGMALPMTPVQILWINLITSVTLGIALAFEPTESGTMRRPPRPRDEPLLGGALVLDILLVSFLFMCGVFALFFYAIHRGYSIELARTIAVNTLVVLEIFYLFFIRNIYGTSLTWKAVSGTPVVWLTVGIITVAQFAITYLPPLQAVFKTQAVPLLDGMAIIGVGIVFFVILEIEKQLRLAFQRMKEV